MSTLTATYFIAGVTTQTWGRGGQFQNQWADLLNRHQPMTNLFSSRSVSLDVIVTRCLWPRHVSPPGHHIPSFTPSLAAFLAASSNASIVARMDQPISSKLMCTVRSTHMKYLCCRRHLNNRLWMEWSKRRPLRHPVVRLLIHFAWDKEMLI